MAKLEDSSDSTLTLAQLHREVLARLRAAHVDDAELSARRILEETTGIDIGQFPAEEGQLMNRRTVVRTDSLTARRVLGGPIAIRHW